MAAPRRKNLLIISSDEMRGDAPAYMGNPDAITPHLDALAARCHVLQRHFTVHGKCVPSRIAFLTGRHPHTDGFRTITQHLPDERPNFITSLRTAGYETAFFGHPHVTEGFWGDNTPGSGLTHYHSYTHGTFKDLLAREWPAPPAPPPGARAGLPLFDGPGERYHPRLTTPRTGFCDDNRAEQAIHYLRTVRDRTRPFFLQVNFGLPHPRYQIEEPWFSRHDPARLRAPYPHDLPSGAPEPLRRMREIRTGLDCPREVFLETQAVYLAMVEKVDELIGRVVAAIDAEHLWEDTVVLFWVDHGDFAGQYGLHEKYDTALQDCILHVPMLVWDPDLPVPTGGRRHDGLTDTTDLAPTLCETLGLDPLPGMHGTSLLPLLRGAAPGHAAVFASGGHEEEMCARFAAGATGRAADPQNGKQLTYRRYPHTMARAMSVRTATHKLVLRLAGGHELYDLAADPREMVNRYGDPALAAVEAELLRHLALWQLRTQTDRPWQASFGA